MKNILNKKAGILIGLLVIPALLLYIIPRMMDKKFEVRHYEDEIVDPNNSSRDTISTVVKDFSFIDQNGKAFTKEDVNNKIYVSSFYFTKDKKISRRAQSMLCRVHEYFRSNEDVMILSHTTDSSTDSISEIKQFSKDYVVNENTWKFLLGEKEYVSNVAEQSYLLSVVKEGKPTYNKMVTLVDRSGRVRGFFDAYSFRDVSRLITEIRILLQEDENK